MGSSADENRKHPLDAVIRELVAKGEVSEDVLYDSDTIIRWWRSLDPTKQEEIKSRVEELSQGVFAEVSEKKMTTKGEPDNSPIYTLIEEEPADKVSEEPSVKRFAIPSTSRSYKTHLIFVSLALVAVIVYSVVITGDRDALNTELESVQSILASTRADLSSTQAELSSTQAELSSTQAELSSTRADLSSTQAELSSTQAELSSTQAEVSSTKESLTSTNQRLSSVQNELGATKTELDTIEAKLKLYEDTMGITIFSGIQQPPLRGASPIKLVNSPAATDPSWQQLMSFLLADPTDDRTWTEGIFVSGDFAEMLHNNAERAGIRAALVGVFFEGETIGHGLNAFKTTDRGLVYVDSTGPTLEQKQEIQYQIYDGTPIGWDKIAYVTKGKEYGLVSLEQDTPIDYASYEKMKADWGSYASKLEAYNQEVAEYNSAYSAYERDLAAASLLPLDSSFRQFLLRGAEITQGLFKLRYGRTFEAEEKYLKEQREWLNSIRAQLEKAWEPMGITESIKIYW